MFRPRAHHPVDRIGPRRTTLVGAGAFFSAMLFSTATAAIGLGEIEVRSYLAEELNLRIGVIAGIEDDLDLSCFSVANGAPDGASATPQIGRRDVSLSLVEARGLRYLQLRGTRAYNEPLAKLSIRAGYRADAGINREFIILLDPPPALAPPLLAVPLSAAVTRREPLNSPTTDNSSSVTAPKPSIAAQGMGERWTVYAGDTLASIATGIFPRSRARRNAYISALREQNPSLANVRDTAPLAVGSLLYLPNLQAIARSAPRPPQRVNDNAAAPAARSGPGSAAKAARPTAPRTKSAGKPRASGDRFSLRLSGGEVDLSRSEGISEDVRAQIRAKQMLLDADDQIAQLLSLKNTVKQLEGRLNDMQLKLAATTAAPATATPPTTLPATMAPPIAEPGANASAASANIKIDSAVATPPGENPAAAKNSLGNGISKIPSDVAPTRATDARPLGAAAWVIALLLAVFAASGTAWFMARRRRAADPHDAIWTPPPAPASANIAPAFAGQIMRTANDTENSIAAADALRVANDRAEAEHDAALLMAIRDNRGDRSRRTESPTPIVAASLATLTPPFFETSQAHMPRSSEPLADRFDLDNAPMASVDFPLDDDDHNNVDTAADVRIRRLRYMHECFPELANQTVSIDDTESMINAARLYHGESAGDRACELLNFAIEERPQENRFWLAQFEIYRLDNRADEFTALATKFHLLFSHTEAWPKVRHIGHQLDPSNPLFAAAGRAAENGLRFDPAAENWLNAPMDFSVDNLVGELRNALFSDHGVGASDFDAISARLSAHR